MRAWLEGGGAVSGLGVRREGRDSGGISRMGDMLFIADQADGATVAKLSMRNQLNDRERRTTRDRHVRKINNRLEEYKSYEAKKMALNEKRRRRLPAQDEEKAKDAHLRKMARRRKRRRRRRARPRPRRKKKPSKAKKKMI